MLKDKLKNAQSEYSILIGHFKTYIILIAFLAIMMVPVYFQVLNVVKNGILSDTSRKIEYGLSFLENEFDSFDIISKQLLQNSNFQFIKNMNTFNLQNEYLTLRDLNSFFMSVSNFMFVKDDIYLMFKDNDVMVAANRAYDDARKVYNKLWRYDGKSFDSFKDEFFGMDGCDTFVPGYKYTSITFNSVSDLTYLHTVSGGRTPSAILICLYNSNNILKICGLDEIAKAGHIKILNADGKICAEINNMHPDEKSESYIKLLSRSGRMGIEVSIPTSYYAKRIKSICTNTALYMSLILLVGFLTSITLAYKQGKPLKHLVSFLSEHSGRVYSVGDAYEYIEKEIKSISDESTKANRLLLDKLFVKMILTGLTEKEREEFHKLVNQIPHQFYIVLIKNSMADKDVLNTILEDILMSSYIKAWKTIVINERELVLLLDKEDININKLKSYIRLLNSQSCVDIRVAVSNLQKDIYSITSMYYKIREMLKYSEYGTLMVFEDIKPSSNVTNSIFEKIENTKQLYNLIKIGNAFEANRMVYEQWYNIVESPELNNGIAEMFYAQIRILSQVATETGYKEALPTFDIEVDAANLAFSITSYIEKICKYIEETRSKDDYRTNKILQYINEHCYESSFYLIDLGEKFSLSPKYLAQLVKNVTGQTFSNYVSYLRLQRSETLLTTTSMPINDVALLCGFDSSNSFYKAFKKAYGISPIQYRKCN